MSSRPGRLGHGWLRWLAVPLALGLVLVLAGPALAQPAPTTTTPPTTVPGAGPTTTTTTLGPPGGTLPPQVGGCGEASEREDQGGLIEAIMPGTDPGPCPIERYQIYVDTDFRGVGNLTVPTNWVSGMYGALSNAFFAISKFSIQMSLSTLNFAYSFPLTTKRDPQHGGSFYLTNVAGRISDLYKTKLIDYLGLVNFTLLLALAYAGWQTFRGRLAHGTGEFAISLLIYLAALLTIGNPGSVIGFDRAMEAASNVSGAVLSLAVLDPDTPANDCPGASPSPGSSTQGTTFRPIACRLHIAFVQQPYDLLNWGAILEPNSECAKKRNEILNLWPYGSENPDTWKKYMTEEPPCDRYHRAVRAFPATRLAAAFFLMLASLVVVIMLIALGLAVVIAEAMAVMLLALAWPAFTAGLLPGGARHLFWRWATAMLTSFATIIVMSAFLSFFVSTIELVLKLNGGTGTQLFAQYMVLDLVAVMMFVMRRRLARGARQTVRVWGSRHDRSHAPRVAGTWAGGDAPLALGLEHELDIFAHRVGTQVARDTRRAVNKSRSG